MQRSVGTGILALPNILSNFPCTGHTMPSLNHTLIITGNICDTDCKVVFKKHAVVVYNPQQRPIITELWEPTGSKLWRISLHMDPTNIHVLPTNSERASLQVFSAYDLLSVEDLVQ